MHNNKFQISGELIDDNGVAHGSYNAIVSALTEERAKTIALSMAKQDKSIPHSSPLYWNKAVVTRI